MNEEHYDSRYVYKVISRFFFVFSLLILIAVFFTDGFVAKITNAICGFILIGTGLIFNRLAR